MGRAAFRALYFTPINYHFNADEIAYILDDCDAHGVRDLDVPR